MRLVKLTTVNNENEELSFGGGSLPEDVQMDADRAELLEHDEDIDFAEEGESDEDESDEDQPLGAYAIREAISDGTGNLDNGCTPITYKGIQEIELELKNKDSTLHTLCLHRAIIDDESAITLASALDGNTSLKELFLEGNHITDKAVPFIIQGIRRSGLEELSLDHNKITNKGAIELQEFFQSGDSSLNFLSISGNIGVNPIVIDDIEFYSWYLNSEPIYAPPDLENPDYEALIQSLGTTGGTDDRWVSLGEE